LQKNYALPLSIIDVNYDKTYHPVKSVTFGTIRTPIVLKQNYPNPFYDTTNIGFTILNHGHVSLEVFNLFGELVARIVSSDLDPGEHTIEWTPAECGAGFYYYQLRSGEYSVTKRLLLID